MLFVSQAYADYREDAGYSRLQTELGLLTPNGAGVAATQVEVAQGVSETNVGAWIPDTSAAQFAGKTIVDQSDPVSNGISSHSTSVGNLFYGNNAMASGIIDVDVYSASEAA